MTETIELGCIERFTFGKEGVEKVQSFHQEMPDYLNRAVAGENKYNLLIDKDWTQFVYESSKMSWKKILVLLIGIAPSLTKFPSFFAQRVLINECSIENYDQNGKYTFTNWFTVQDCIKYNGGSQWYQRQFFSLEINDIIKAIGFFLLLAVPQWIFLALVWSRFRNSKYTVWMSSAKIHLTSFSKRLLTFGYSIGCFFLFIGSLFLSIFIQSLGAMMFTTAIHYNLSSTQRIMFGFDRTQVLGMSTFISNLLIYSCLLTLLINHIREPIAFFTGFRMYLKKASTVPYNTTAVDFRIKKDAFNWKCIRMYYEQCHRYAPHVVLNAMTTHFLDLEIFEADKSSGSFASIKTE